VKLQSHYGHNFLIKKIPLETDNKKLYRDIAEEVNLGQTCYLNKETKAFFCIPNFDDEQSVEEAFAAEIARLKEEKEQLVKLEQPDGKAGYMISKFNLTLWKLSITKGLLLVLNKKYVNILTPASGTISERKNLPSFSRQ
jgi:hypothetical protein